MNHKGNCKKTGMSRGDFLKVVGAGVCVAGLHSLGVVQALAETPDKGASKTLSKSGESSAQGFPTRENPLLIDEKKKRVLIYSEVHEMNVHQPNVHWGVVFKDGKFQDRAILKAYANQLDFHDAMIKIGAKPGNNLNKETVGKFVEGDTPGGKSYVARPGERTIPQRDICR